MALTRDFKQTVKARAQRDAFFREALLTESVECLLAGDMDVGKAMLRNCMSACCCPRLTGHLGRLLGTDELAWRAHAEP